MAAWGVRAEPCWYGTPPTWMEADVTIQVLIVDDQETFRSAARMVVEMTDDFEVVGEATTGEEGVELAGSLGPDLVLMDLNMPGIDGLEATRRIRAASPSVRVVVLSTYDAASYGAPALAAGAVAFLSKSTFSPDELAGAWGAPEVA